MASVVNDFEARWDSPDFRLTFGPPEFDAAVRAIVDRADRVSLGVEDSPPVGDDLEEGDSFVMSFSGIGDHHHAVPTTPAELAERAEAEMRAQKAGEESARAVAEQARRDQLDAVWEELREVLPLWRPLSDNHIAPAVLRTHPLLTEVITPERGREILSLRRS